jgi:glycosyltransferase involved in cell wall biosynthesis
MKVLILAEYYPRRTDPALGQWVHRQALAARAAGAEVRVLVLYRPLPPLRALRSLDLGAARAAIGQPGRETRDGLTVDYARYLSPPRPWSYANWGAWAAPVVARVLNRVRDEFPFELIHAHYAVPAGDSARRAAPDVPLIVSVHGGDVHGPHATSPAVTKTLARAELVLANSAGTSRRCRAHGARRVKVVHLGADVPAEVAQPPASPVLVTVGNLIERKRHADVIAALPRLLRRHPQLRYVIVGDGPERARLDEQAVSLGVADRIEFSGPVEPSEAVRRAQSATAFVLPSVAEAFGVGYIEAMAAGVPAVGSRGEDGPEEIAAAGGGLQLVPPRDPAALAACLDRLLSDPELHRDLSEAARETVQASFTWTRCGAATVAAYRDVLGGSEPAPSFPPG